VAESVDLSGLADALSRATRLPADYGPLLGRVEGVLAREYLICFDGSRDPSGVPWTPLRGRRGKPLVRSGALRSSGRARRGPRGVAYGSDSPYAGYQNFGTRTIPARPFVGVSEAVADEIAGLAADWLAANLGG
jgi:phage gpG-like protein